MNILIAADNFKFGGLETHIDTLYQELKNNNNVYFAFANFEDPYNYPEEIVYKDFHFNINCSIGEFCEDVERLVRIIETKNIDVININPFYSIYPILFAAHLTQVKDIYISWNIFC